MGLGTRIAEFVGGIRKAAGGALTPVGAGNSSPGFASWLMGATGGAIIREPFTGAWQRNISEAAAMGPNVYANSAVFTCTNIISSDISILPVQVLRVNPADGIREEHRFHPAWLLMQQPNSYQTTLQFIQQYLTSKLTNGNTYVLLLRDARTVINEMHVLNPSRVQPLTADDGSIFYKIGKDVLAGVEEITVPARDMLHDRAMTLWHPLVGMSPLFAAGMSAMMAGRMQMASEQFFANMARSSGVLIAPGKIDPVVARKLQTEWEANYSGHGLGRTAVLSNGLDYKPMTISAADSEMVSQLRWTIEDIARVYRVPQYMVGEMSKATYRNSEQMSRDYFRQCLAYHIRAFEQCFTKAFGMAPGTEVVFDLSDMFRMEADVRFANHQISLNSGFKSINEVRWDEDMPPVPGGDEPRVQMQYVPLSQANVPPPASTPAPAPPPPAAEPAPSPPAPKKQLELDFDPVQMEMLVDAFVERFDLGETNGS